MKTLVVYYSLTGNTRRIAEVIAAELGSDMLALTPVNDIPGHGFMKYARGGRQALGKSIPALLPFDRDPNDYERIVLGTPVWAWTMTPAMRAFLSRYPLSGRQVAVFCCHGGGRGATFKHIRGLAPEATFIGECDFIEPLKKRTVEAELRAREWARSL